MKQIIRIGALLAFSSAALFAQPAVAGQPQYNQVALRAEVSQSVAHDEMQVTLYSEAQDSDPAKLASLISKKLNSAVETSRAAKDVRVSLGSRHSYPVYDDKQQKITG